MKSHELLGAGWSSFQDCHPMLPKIFPRPGLNFVGRQADKKARNQRQWLPRAS